jgi:hypothetical protein
MRYLIPAVFVAWIFLLLFPVSALNLSVSNSSIKTTQNYTIYELQNNQCIKMNVSSIANTTDLTLNECNDLISNNPINLSLCDFYNSSVTTCQELAVKARNTPIDNAIVNANYNMSLKIASCLQEENSAKFSNYLFYTMLLITIICVCWLGYKIKKEK